MNDQLTENTENNLDLSGLTANEVAERVEKGLVNGDQTIKTKSVAQILFSHIFTYFNFVFLAIAIILAVFTGFGRSGIGNYGFMILVVFNSTVGIAQELRAKYTMDKLSLISAPKVTVVRDGEEKESAVKDIVLDDLTVLFSGCQITADSEVVSGEIEVNESLVTGEPDAILKRPGDSLVSGSFVVSGRAYARVVHVGMENFAMKISAGAKYFKKPVSEIKNSLGKVIRVMSYIIVPIGVALFCVKYFSDPSKLVETVESTMGSLVGMIPSGLVALTSAVFCLSVIRLSKHNTLAQDLYCVETLARVDVLCLDKTGTITEGRMEVSEVKTSLPENEFLGILKNLTSALTDENATIDAVRDFVKETNANEVADGVVPFSSARKWSGAHFGGKSYVMGAPEFVFPEKPDEVQSVTENMAEKGLRVLAVAVSEKPFDGSVLPDDLSLIGFIFITDKIRKEAPDTLNFFREQGVNVKIISGDNPATVRAVAERAGLDGCESCVDMSTLKTEAEIIEAAEKYNVFGRVLPDQKLTLVRALKAAGHTVAMTGDGVNDVLALKEADCSVAMASGSDAAKNVSSLVLLDSNFASMPRVVAEGRRSITNLERSASLFLVKTVYSLLIALLFFIVPDTLPFAPKHLTLLGGVTIGIPSTVLALEPTKKRVSGRFLPKILVATLPGVAAVMTGIVSVVITTQCVLTNLTLAEEQCLYFLVTVFAGYLYVIKVCCPFNKLHIALISFVVLLLVGAYLVPWDFLQSFFGLTKNISPSMWRAIGVSWAIVMPVFAIFWLIDKRYKENMQDGLGRLMDKGEARRAARASRA